MAFRDLAARSNYYYQMDAQKDAEKRRSNPKPRHHQHQSEHEIYCDQMGILFPNGLNAPYAVRRLSYLHDRKKEARGHTYQYWFVASLTTLFFLLQVIIGAAQIALGATHAPHILVTVFGAVATVIGGILAYLKSRGQPNRTRQLRNSLRKVVEEIEFQEIQLRNPDVKTTAKQAVDYVNQLYEDARFQAETNYPDFWSTAGTKAKKPADGPAVNAKQNSSSDHPLAAQLVAGQRESKESTGNQSPSYHPVPMQPQSTQLSTSIPPPDKAKSSHHYTEPKPPSPSAHISSNGGKPLQAPDPAAHISSDGGRPLQQSNRAAHVKPHGGKYMNTMV